MLEHVLVGPTGRTGPRKTDLAPGRSVDRRVPRQPGGRLLARLL